MAKFRMGFVSNSSSLIKGLLTDAQIEEFRQHNNRSNEGYINESKSVFFGDKDYHFGTYDDEDKQFELSKDIEN